MDKYTKKTLIKYAPYAVVVLVAVAIILAVLLITKNYKKDDAESTPEVSTSSVDSTEDGEFPTVAATDAINVDQLIDRYYQAKLNNDADGLNSIVDTDTPYNVADLANESQYIARYDNFKTYVIPGLTDNYFIVYVKYDIFFNDIETGAASLNHFVIAKDGDYYYIVDRIVSDEFNSYIAETENSETVQNLKKQVEEELQAACAADEKLNFVISFLNGDVEIESVEETEEITDAPVEETEAPVEDTEAADEAESAEEAPDESESE